MKPGEKSANFPLHLCPSDTGYITVGGRRLYRTTEEAITLNTVDELVAWIMLDPKEVGS